MSSVFVWNFWREVCISGLQMAAQTASVVSAETKPSKNNPLESIKNVLSEPEKPLSVILDSAPPERIVMHNPEIVAFALSDALRALVAHDSTPWLQHMDVASCSISLRGVCTQLSPNWDIVVGLDALDCQGEGLMMALHPYYRHALLEKLDMLYEGMEDGACFGIFSTRLRCQIADCDGGWRWFDVKLLADETAGEPVCRVMLWDVHEQVMTEKQLRTAHIEAELAQRGRYEFLGHMSHELRTPLNAMLGFSEMMEQGVMGQIENPHYKEYLVNIRESGNLLLHRISDMVEIVNIEMGAYVVDDEQVQLADLLQSAVRLYAHDAMSRKVQVVVEGVVPRMVVFGDRVKLVRALGNIMSNAVRFSLPDARVRVACIENAAGSLTIAVHDHGAGMSENHLAMLRMALSERHCLFQQSPESVGVGLGLAVAKEFLELHDASVRIDSVKDTGTSVYVGFPVSRVVSLETPAVQAKRRESVNY